MDEDKEIKISKEIAEKIMGRDVDFIKDAQKNAVCHDCVLQRKNISMKEVSGYYLNGVGDIILRGVCANCGGNDCVSQIASSTDPNKMKIAVEYLTVGK